MKIAMEYIHVHTLRIHARTQACPYTRSSRASCEAGCHSILLEGSRQAYRTYNIRGARHSSIPPSIHPSLYPSLHPPINSPSNPSNPNPPYSNTPYPIQPPKSPSKQLSALSKKNYTHLPQAHTYLRPVLSRRTSADIPSGGVMKRSYLRGDPLQRGKVYPVNLRS